MNIIYKNQDGSVAVFTPTQEALDQLKIEEIAQRVVPVNTEYQIVDPSAIPTDRTFRDAWEHNQDGINVNIEKAKSIAHDKRRTARTEEFKPLDIQAAIPALAEQAEAKRQIIRDEFAAIQTEIDNAETIDQLKEIMALRKIVCKTIP